MARVTGRAIHGCPSKPERKLDRWPCLSNAESLASQRSFVDTVVETTRRGQIYAVTVDDEVAHGLLARGATCPLDVRGFDG